MPYKDPARAKQAASEWSRANPGRRYVHQRRYEKGLRTETLELLGNKCSRCGFADARALQIDHVNAGGRKDRISITRNFNRAVMDSVERGEGKYQLLCANCNWIKRFENREHFHPTK